MSLLVVDKTPCSKFTQDDTVSVWHSNRKATEAVVKLISTPVEMIGHGVEHAKIVNNFKIDTSKDGATNLLTRPESRSLVGKALTGDLRATCEMVGSPGIGKSWSLLYALQEQACLFDGANVCLFVSKGSTAYLFLRRGNKCTHGPHFFRARLLALSSIGMMYWSCIIHLRPVLQVCQAQTMLWAYELYLLHCLQMRSISSSLSKRTKDRKGVKLALQPFLN
jgi:hypothetical protein